MNQSLPNFVDATNVNGPFEGCLIVLNITQEELLAEDFVKVLSEAVAQAHADGWAVLYLHDNDKGASPVPDFVPQAEGHDFPMLMSNVCSREKASFSLVPSKKNDEFQALFDNIMTLEGFCFEKNVGKLIGKCKLGGDDVMVPLTKIDP